MRPEPERDAMTRRLMPLCAGFAAVTIAANAGAELLYEFTFHATVANVWGENPDHPWGGVEIGDPAYFRYVIDVEQEDQASPPWLGWYDVESVEISYDGISVVPGFVDRLEVDTFTTSGQDVVKLVNRQIWTDDFNEGAIFELRGFGVLPDDSIPIEFDLFDFGVERAIGYGDGTLGFRAEFDSYTYRIIPAPTGALALVIGVIFRGRRRRRPHVRS